MSAKEDDLRFLMEHTRRLTQLAIVPKILQMAADQLEQVGNDDPELRPEIMAALEELNQVVAALGRLLIFLDARLDVRMADL